MTANVEKEFQKGLEINDTDLGKIFEKVSPTLLKGEIGKTISYDTPKTIFTSLPGNTTAFEDV